MYKTITLLFSFLMLFTARLAADTVWDIAGKGFSEGTVANLAADAANWEAQGDPVARYRNRTTMSGELSANGQIITETAGIRFGSMSANKINIDFGYVPSRVMLNGTNLTFTLQGLMAGQKITIVTMTANTSSARGISCSSGNATRLAGEATSLIENTNVFEVNAEVTGEVDVTFTTGSTGGVHLRYISMDGDDDIDPDAPISIAYIYDSTHDEGTTIVGTEDDPILQYALMQKNVTLFNIANITDDTSVVFADSLAALENYDVVVISEAISSQHAFGKQLVKLVNRVPMLNTKSFFYGSDSWNWGSGVNPTNIGNSETGIPSVMVDMSLTNHALFTDLDISDGLTLYTGDVTDKNLVQAYTASEGGLIASDQVIAYVTNGTDTLNAIHEHGTSNTYLLIPLSSDAQETIAEEAITLVYNAVVYLAATKEDVIPATRPTILQSYFDQYTTVSMSTITADASIYYTTDGTEPTTSSLLYTEPLTITDSCTIKAFTVKQGYDNSTVATAVILVKTTVGTPTIHVIADGAAKTVTITAAEGSTVYYTTNGATPAAASATLYTEPFTLTRPCTVKAIGTQTGKLDSEVATEIITIDGYAERTRTLEWANFYDRPYVTDSNYYWSWAMSDTIATANVDLFGKAGYAYNDSIATINFNNGFIIGTYGQRVNIQTGGVATSGNYSPFTEADQGATGHSLSFLRTNLATDPTTAFMTTSTAYAGPFDVVVWITGGKGSDSYTEKLEVSVANALTDAEWTVLDTLTTLGDKYIRKRVAYYDDAAPVFVKIASVSDLGTNSNMLIFDLKLMGEGEDPVQVKKPMIDRTLVSTRIYTISGVQVKSPVFGMNIIRSMYSDGSVETMKVIVKERL